MALKPYIEKLRQRLCLSAAETKLAIHGIIKGVSSKQSEEFLLLLKAKGETAEEMMGIVHTMQALMTPVTIEGPLLDIVGTGGDGSHSINISTGSSILAASGCIRIAKHGNRASSSKCGSADVLEALGINLKLGPDTMKELDICFLYAPNYHPAMKKIYPVRKKLGKSTVFNLLGPLLNPARPDYYLIGVYDELLLDLIGDVLIKLGVKRAMVVHGNGMDELTPIGPCTVVDIQNGQKTRFQLDPKNYGFAPCTMKDLQGGDATKNAEILTSVFSGQEGPVSDTLVLNAGVAHYIYGTAPSIKKGIEKARASLKNGDAFQLLEKWKTRS